MDEARKGEKAFWANTENKQILKAVERLKDDDEEMTDRVMVANYGKNWKQKVEQAKKEIE